MLWNVPALCMLGSKVNWQRMGAVGAIVDVEACKGKVADSNLRYTYNNI